MEKTANYHQILLNELKELPEEILSSYKNLQKEFDDLEQLSEEALMEFEKGL